MSRYLVKKIGLAIFVLFGITLLVFLLGKLSPGDPAEIRLSSGGNYTPSDEELDAVRKEMGLDKSFCRQYADWSVKVLHGDLGVSFRTGKPVAEEIAARFRVTAQIAGLSILITAFLGLSAGLLMALSGGGLLSKAGHFISMFSISVPGFWMSLLFIRFFSEKMRWLPTSGQGSWRHLVMPVSILSLGSIGMIIRLAHSSLDTQMRRHYVLVAMSKGMSRKRAAVSHALLNALIPVITLLGNNLGAVLGGAAVVESVFAINGLGKFALDSIDFRDYPALQGYVMVSGFAFVTVSLLLDLSYALINPRIRHGKND